jgi:hypothetical protein
VSASDVEVTGGAADGIDSRAVLVEPARLRAVSIAAEMLGRLPADEVPQPLRAIARFAAAKRARLGAAVLAAALDADPDFRAKVADLVESSTPQLVEAVRTGAPTGASDPLDTSVVAYLVRPDGWEAIVTAANERWSRDSAQADSAADETGRLRRELAELRTRSKTEAARSRSAVAAATEDVRAELVVVRRQLRERSGELRSAQRALDTARAAAEDTQRRVESQGGMHDAEVRRLRARIAELERSGESNRRATRADRDLDDARLWLLVDTLSEAAAGIRRELSLAPTAMRPAETVASGTAGRIVRQVADAVAFERLLGLPDVHLIVDGYNVTKTGYAELSLAEQRTRLIGSLVAVAARLGVEITVAFDGGAKLPAQPPTPRGVRVLFSAADEIADDLIRRLVAAEPQGRPVVVVTSDQQVVTDVLAAGTWAVPSAVLLERLG